MLAQSWASLSCFFVVPCLVSDFELLFFELLTLSLNNTELLPLYHAMQPQAHVMALLILRNALWRCVLQEMGNVYINAGREVLFRGYSGDPSKINESVSWQYAMNNGPASIFSGNAWSLDICVDHSVEDLVTLSLRLIILLIIEVRVATWSTASEEHCQSWYCLIVSSSSSRAPASLRTVTQCFCCYDHLDVAAAT